MIESFWPIRIACASCDGRCQMVAPPARSSSLCDQMRSVWRCIDCGRTFTVTVSLSATSEHGHTARPKAGKNQPTVCGTERGYQRHRTNDEHADDWCKAAHREYQRRTAAGLPRSNTTVVPEPTVTPIDVAS